MDSWRSGSATGDLEPLSLSWITSSIDMGYEYEETDPAVIEVSAHVELRHHDVYMPYDDADDDEGLGMDQDIHQDDIESVASNEVMDLEEEFEDMDSDPEIGEGEEASDDSEPHEMNVEDPPVDLAELRTEEEELERREFEIAHRNAWRTWWIKRRGDPEDWNELASLDPFELGGGGDESRHRSSSGASGSSGEV